MKEIPLTQGKVALVDDDDFEWLNQWKWCCAPQKHGTVGKFYALRGKLIDGKVKLLYMHRVILGATGEIVDHVDGNGLNNQRSNIRLCTISQNQMNRNPGKHKGVHLFKRTNRWTAYISKHGARTHLGSFDSKIEAIIAYNDAAKKLFGEFARLNTIPQ